MKKFVAGLGGLAVWPTLMASVLSGQAAASEVTEPAVFRAPAMPAPEPNAVSDVTADAPKVFAPAEAPVGVSEAGLGDNRPSEEVGSLGLIITARRMREDPFRTPGLITVVGPDAMRYAPLGQAPNLLAHRTGVMIQKSNHGGGSPYLRGLTGKHVLLMVDGVRLNNSLYRAGPHQYLNTVDPYTVGRIEVVHGPASVLYGTDALGGVVNVITREPAADQGRTRMGFSVGGATADRSLRGRVQGQGASDGTSILGGVSLRRFMDLDGGGDVPIQRATGYDEAGADLKIVHELSARWEVLGTVQHLRQFDVPKSNEVLLGGKYLYNYDPQTRTLIYGQVRGNELDDAVIADTAQAGVSLQLHEEGERVIAAAGGPETRERNNVRTYGAMAHLSKGLPLGNRLGYGAEMYADRVASEKIEYRSDVTGLTRLRPAFPDGAIYNGYGVYAENVWAGWDLLRLHAGGRYSAFRATGSLTGAGKTEVLNLDVNDWTWSGGATVFPIEEVALSSQAARGFRAPNMEDFFGKVDFAQEIPNTSLKPEESLDIQSGIKWRGYGVDAQAFHFVSFFENLIDRASVSKADLDGDGDMEDVIQRQNVGRARIQGVAGGASIRPVSMVQVDVNASWTKGNTIKSVAGEDVEEPLRRIPPLQGAVQAMGLWPEGHFAGVELDWAAKQDRLAPNEPKNDPRIPVGGTPGYAVVHLRSGATTGHGEFKLGVENLLDAKYKTHGSGVYLPGRSFYFEYAIGM